MSLCGRHVCVTTTSAAEAFDRHTGKPVWRRDIKEHSTIQATQAGTVLSAEGSGSIILDPSGKDVTPADLGMRTAYWLDGEHLILSRVLGRAVMSRNIIPAEDVELSVYSLKKRQEQPLGRHRLRSGCTGIPDTRYVCAGEHGFILFR